jgi:hypothetical protein
MSKRPQDRSAEEPDGGNPHIRFRGGLGRGNRPGLLNKLADHIRFGRIRFLVCSTSKIEHMISTMCTYSMLHSFPRAAALTQRSDDWCE